ncbi:MAG: methylenetetrahydrofolate reductase [Acidimicrobiaceae bacterium]|nr:methylenetetrahydrofolate reductase [Acidimicrobiaceae bacterium]
MRVVDLLARGRTLSFEFFPPKTDEAQAQLTTTIAELAPLHPDFFSVTYGAQGGERTRTRDVVVALAHNGSIPPVAHLTCVGHTQAEIDALLGEYKAAGVKNILALGGDQPADPTQVGPSDFRFAQDLVEYVQANSDICIGVAAHPEVHPRSPSRESDRQHLAEKLRLADFAMTQFFFDVDHYQRLVDELSALGVHKPVLPGVMPVTNKSQLVRMAQMSGSEIPQWLNDRLAPFESPNDIRQAGVEIATQLCTELLAAGAPGLHIYTLNRSTAAREIALNLGLGQA